MHVPLVRRTAATSQDGDGFGLGASGCVDVGAGGCDCAEVYVVTDIVDADWRSVEWIHPNDKPDYALSARSQSYSSRSVDAHIKIVIAPVTCTPDGWQHNCT